MLTLKKCNEVLNENEKKYSEKEVKEIRELLYKVAQILTQQKTKNNED